MLSEDEEFDIAISAVAIYLKLHEERSPEEQAYVLAMQEYYKGMTEHAAKVGNAVPVHGLASGTCLLFAPEDKRTREEQMMVEELVHEYYRELDLTYSASPTSASGSNGESKIEPELTLEEQVMIAEAASRVFAKRPEERTPEEHEYVNRMEEYAEEIAKMEREAGLQIQHNLASGTMIFAKFEEERKPEENEYVQEVLKLGKF